MQQNTLLQNNKRVLAEVGQNQFVNQNDLTQQKQPLNKFDRLKFLKNLRIQQDMRKLKNCLSTQKQMNINQSQRKKIQSQIQRYQQFLKLKKKEFIQQNLQRVEQRKKQRLQINNLTNKQLQEIKKKNQLRRKKLQSIVTQYKQQQQKKYQNVINQRKVYRVPINIKQINQHQKVYFHQKLEHSKLSSQNTMNLLKCKKRKINTESSQNTTFTFPENNNSLPPEDRVSIFFQAKPSKTTHNQISKNQIQDAKNLNQQRKQYMMALFFKRNQYGNKMQNNCQKFKGTKEKTKRTKTQFSTRKQQCYDENKIKSQYTKDNYHQKQIRKPKLQTNNPINNWKQGSLFQIHNLAKNYDIDDTEKVLRLNMLQEKFKYYQIIKSGNPEAQLALQLRTQANIVKANLLLKHDY